MSMGSVNPGGAARTGVSGGARSGGMGIASYLLVFGAYVLLNVFAPHSMAAMTVSVGNEREVTLGGWNMALILGAGLVVGSVAVAVVEWTRDA